MQCSWSQVSACNCYTQNLALAVASPQPSFPHHPTHPPSGTNSATTISSPPISHSTPHPIHMEDKNPCCLRIHLVLYTLDTSQSYTIRLCTQPNNYSGKTSVKLCNHKRHPITYPYGWAMGCPSWVIQRKITGICISRAHCTPINCVAWCLSSVSSVPKKADKLIISLSLCPPCISRYLYPS